jgi:hypothetical protein
MVSSGTLYRVAQVWTEVSEEHIVLFAASRMAYRRYEKDRFKSFATLNMEAICSTECQF